MEVYFAPEMEAKLNQLAADRGPIPESLLLEAVEHFIDYDEWFIRQVEKGLAQIDAGELLEHEQVGNRLARLFSRPSHP